MPITETNALHLLRRLGSGAAPSRVPSRRQRLRPRVLGARDLLAELRRFVLGEGDRIALLSRLRTSGMSRLGREGFTCQDRIARIERARALLAVVLDERYVPDPHASRRLAAAMLSAIEHGRSLPARMILRKLFSFPDVVHLATRPLGGSRSWADVAYLAPLSVCSPRGRTGADWFIAFTVATDRFWREGLGGLAAPRWPDPLQGASDTTPRLRRKRGSARLSASFRYLVDQDGLSHVVFDADALGEGEVREAARLFALHNGIRSVYLDGSLVLEA